MRPYRPSKLVSLEWVVRGRVQVRRTFIGWAVCKNNRRRYAAANLHVQTSNCLEQMGILTVGTRSPRTSYARASSIEFGCLFDHYFS
jgi:hypothetical protein